MRGQFNIGGLYQAALKDRTPERFTEELTTALQEGEVKPSELSLRELFIQLHPDCGHHFVEQWFSNPENKESLLEAGVMSSTFSNISKQLLATEVMAGYEDAPFIGEQLVRTIPTRSPYGERVGGLGRIGNEAEAIGEGQPYPLVGFGEDWVQTPEPIKRGMICAITREAIVADRTGQLYERAREVGYWIRYNKELRILNVALGIVPTYNRRGRGVVATYGDNSGSHDWDNLVASTALVDETDIEAAYLAFSAITDPNTGTPVNVMGRDMVVPTGLEWTARRLTRATQIEYVDNQANAMTRRFTGPNPVASMGLNIITSPLVSSVVGNSTTWFIGDFKRAFSYREVSPVTTVEAPTNNEMEFTRDIVFRVKTSEWGAAAVDNPRYALKMTA